LYRYSWNQATIKAEGLLGYITIGNKHKVYYNYTIFYIHEKVWYTPVGCAQHQFRIIISLI